MDKPNQIQNSEGNIGIKFLVGCVKKGAVLTALNNLCAGSRTSEPAGPVDYETHRKQNLQTYEIHVSEQSEADRILQDLVKYCPKK